MSDGPGVQTEGKPCSCMWSYSYRFLMRELGISPEHESANILAVEKIRELSRVTQPTPATSARPGKLMGTVCGSCKRPTTFTIVAPASLGVCAECGQSFGTVGEAEINELAEFEKWSMEYAIQHKRRVSGMWWEAWQARAKLKAASSLRTASQWIPVEEKLPDEGQSVIIFAYGEVHSWMARRRSFRTHSTRDWLWQSLNGIPKNRVTHWQPLPDPPARTAGKTDGKGQ